MWKRFENLYVSAKAAALSLSPVRITGQGSSRDWRPRGVALAGLNDCRRSFERIHRRTNLLGYGCAAAGISAGHHGQTLGIDGTENLRRFQATSHRAAL